MIQIRELTPAEVDYQLEIRGIRRESISAATGTVKMIDGEMFITLRITPKGYTNHVECAINFVGDPPS